jgi:23S rRNA pseudouridine1911/1915/1917 synthase
MKKTITIKDKDAGQRLDKVLVERLSELSRSQIQKLIEQEAVTVNGKITSIHHFLKTGDRVVVATATKKPAVVTPAKKPSKKSLTPTIIADTDEYVVIDKPIGLLVHPTSKNETDTLVAWLLKHYPKIKKVGDDPTRPGIVHRLDRDVSGAMVIAKTPKAFTNLKNQFQERAVKKIYVALVYGNVPEPGEITIPIGRSTEGKFVAHPTSKGERLLATDRFAKTEYTPIEWKKQYTLLQVEILTGRTHQIRAHLAAINHPIVGDTMYTPRSPMLHVRQRKVKVLHPGRIFLHATTLAFTDLAGVRQTFTTPTPEELEAFLEKI